MAEEKTGECSKKQREKEDRQRDKDRDKEDQGGKRWTLPILH